MEKDIFENENLIYFVLKQKNLSPEEFYDLGMIGLIKGIKTYNSSKGYAKSTYLVACVKNEINGYFRKNKIQTVSLNAVYNEDGHNEFIDTIPDKNLLPDEVLEERTTYDVLYQCVEKLPEKYKQIVIHHYGLYDTERMTLIESAKALNLNVGQPQMSRLLAIALKKLRKMMEENDVNETDKFDKR